MERNRVTSVVVAGVAALLVVLGSVLPWVSVSTPFGSIGFAGTNEHLIGASHNGTMTLVLGLVAGACFGLSLLRSDRLLPAAALLVACTVAGIAMYDIVDVHGKISDSHSPVGFASVSIGYGLWITTIAAFGMIVTSFAVLSAAPAVGVRASRPAARPLGQPGAQASPTEYWLRDPFGRHQMRWWDGNAYTDKVMDDGVEGSDPPGKRAAADAAQ